LNDTTVRVVERFS